jgi:hypothetical protein
MGLGIVFNHCLWPFFLVCPYHKKCQIDVVETIQSQQGPFSHKNI